MDLHYSIGEALGTDYFGLREPFTAQQESYLVRTREFVDAEVLPVINGCWERAEFPWRTSWSCGRGTPRTQR
jgi:glutaryl-CoA dehydrogenase